MNRKAKAVEDAGEAFRESARREATREQRKGNLFIAVFMTIFIVVMAFLAYMGATEGKNIHNGTVVSKADHPAAHIYMVSNPEYWTLNVKHDGQVDTIKVTKSVYQNTQVGDKFSN